MTNPVTEAGRALRYAGLDAVREFVSRNYHTYRSSLDPDPVLAADWDVLVVLDACRADLFEAVVDGGDYDGLSAGETRISPASSTDEWLRKVFVPADDRELASMGYVSGNPYTAKVLDADRFAALDEVWRYAWDDDLGTLRPRHVTNRAVELGREHDPERLVVHYMQPHFPPLSEGGGVALSEFGDEPMGIWDELRFGWRSRESAWESYRSNLEAVLEEVEVLLSNVEADRVVVAADHGNAFGEHHIYGHPSGVAVPCLREIPWCVTSATDRGTREGRSYDRSIGADADEDIVADRLRNLGYTA